MLTIGLDIGGANLKGATSEGAARSEPFEIWRAPQDLAGRLQCLISQFPRPDLIAVTMTAELADCFRTKAEGVEAIVAAVRKAASGTPAVFWHTTGWFTPAAQAVRSPGTVAAANWQALATWAGRLAPCGTALLLDIGSTTTDLIPLQDGRPVARGATDLERLLNHELIYTGARRTPLCAVASQVTVRGQPCRVAAELFAAMLDVCLLLELIPEDETDRQTADGRPATIGCAHDRIVRMVCCDREEIDLSGARSIARCFLEAHRAQLQAALGVVVGRGDGPVSKVILSGSGEFLGRQVLAECPFIRSATVIRLAETLSPTVADAACAYAVAVLALEQAPVEAAILGEPSQSQSLSRRKSVNED